MILLIIGYIVLAYFVGMLWAYAIHDTHDTIEGADIVISTMLGLVWPLSLPFLILMIIITISVNLLWSS